MLLALDVGNTNIVIGILDGDKLIKSGLCALIILQFPLPH